MQVGEILDTLDLGNSVAEHDKSLERYFVETATFRSLIRDEGDIIAGDKGTGKTALYTILKQRYPRIPEMGNVELVPGFNPVGTPVFQRLAEGEILEEGQYATVWKAYVTSLVGNWVLGIWNDAFTDGMFELDGVLRSMGLRSVDDSPNTVFSQLVNVVRRLLHPKAAEMAVTLTPDGFPIVVPHLEFGSEKPDGPEPTRIPHDHVLSLLQTVLDEVDLTVWLALDRLDEAFAGFPGAEVPALRALLRTYLDLLPFPRVRLKLFVRNDLFRKVTAGGFVNLTHVNDRKIQIIWDEDDLRDLLGRRLKESAGFVEALGVGSGSVEGVFNATFPTQVDAGKRKPTTWVWMMRRIRDGNDIRPPRNLIDLVKKAQAEQQRREGRSPTEWSPGMPVIGADALKRGLSRLSEERVNDTLLAEAGDMAARWIDRFQGGKAEHNDESLRDLLGVSDEELAQAIRVLLDLGFLERIGTTYKVPSLYRDGLGIRQGKAFGAVGEEGYLDEDENEDDLE